MTLKLDLSKGFILIKKFNQMFIVTKKLAYNRPLQM